MDKARRECLLNLRQQGFIVTEQAGATLVTDAAGETARVESLGLRARVTSPEGRTTEFEQYSSGRVRKITDSAGRTVRFDRDAEGFLQAIDRGPDGGSFRFQLSRDWKPLRIEYPDGTASSAEYSPRGGPTRLVQRDGAELRYEYGPDNRLSALIDPEGQRTELSEPGPGRSRTIAFPNGAREAFVHDPDARVLEWQVNGQTLAHYREEERTGAIEVLYRDRRKETFRFDGGRVVEAANENAAVRFEYDDDGRLLAEEVNGRTVRYLRNKVGALTGIVTPDGDTIAFSRDRDGRLTGITDWTGGRFDIVCPPSGPPQEIRYPNGLTVAATANAMGLPSTWSLQASNDPLQELDTASWTHDLCDRVIADERNGRRREFRYSNASRLTEIRSTDERLNERFELDKRGNRVGTGEAGCGYDAMNRLLRQGDREFSYDDRGNLIADEAGGRETRYTYNTRGHLIAVRAPGVAVDYQYDALGRRTLKRTGGVTTRFEWAGTRLLSETVDDGVQVSKRDYLVCPEFLSPLAFRENRAVYYLHCGRLQEPLSVTDQNRQIVWKAEYLAFGKALISVEKVRQPWRLPGQYHDVETDLHYAVGRYLSPDLGRFLSMDPHRLPGASLNYYTYCDGDPLNRVDPTGEISLTLGTVLVAVGIGIAVGALIGAGVELYKQRNEEKTDWGQVGTAALIGGCLGGIGGAVGAVAGAAALGTLGVLGAGAAAGGLGAAAEYCVQAVGTGEFSWSAFGTSVAVGAGIGAITAGIGGVIAARAARRAAAVAAEEEVARAAAARAAADEAAREAAERAAREAEQKALEEARLAAERARQLPPSKEEKILYGERVPNPNSPGGMSNETIGGHSPKIKSDPDFTVQELAKNPDGTSVVKYKKNFPDGSVGKTKKSTLAPDSWSDGKIVDATHQVADSPPVATRARDGATLHRETIDGVQWEVIRDSNGAITSSYPTGGTPTTTF